MQSTLTKWNPRARVTRSPRGASPSQGRSRSLLVSTRRPYLCPNAWSSSQTKRNGKAGRVVEALRESVDEGGALSSVSPRGQLEADGLAEDSAAFSLENQKLDSWATFAVLLTVVLAGLYVLWVDPEMGGAGARYIEYVQGLLGDPHLVILGLLAIFGVAHSGLAAFRSTGERFVGKRAYRVGFALVSLPLALATVMYFINHRYSGVPLYNLRDVPGVHSLVWMLSFASFFFLYPSTFNLLEVAAVDVPEVHLWETGVIRITRHPQMVGQVVWSFAHCLWIGNSFTLVTNLGLCAYHAFGCWHGDQRLQEKFGKDFDKLKKTTSVLPFAAILEGRQILPKHYWKEFIRAPYLAVILFTVGAYLCHPLMQRAAYWLDW